MKDDVYSYCRAQGVTRCSSTYAVVSFEAIHLLALQVLFITGSAEHTAVVQGYYSRHC